MGRSDTWADTRADMRRRAWRWHFIAALLVIPFVLWQSITGTLYLWSEQWVDQQHPALRFVEPAAESVTLDRQIQLARLTQVGRPVASVLVPADPHRSTQVMFTDARGLPMASFVDPYRGALLGSLQGAAWPVGWSRSVHGGWPLGSAGSWLLEIGACWAIVMVLTGLYLWWPRDGRGLLALIPRLRSGRRVFWRDLHACVAVWFSLVIVLFLCTAMPWTSFWGGNVLQPLQRALGQETPRAAGFAPVFAGGDAQHAAPLQGMLDRAREQGMDGDLSFMMVDGPAGSAVSLRQNKSRSSQERYLLLDRADGSVLEQGSWGDFPLLAKAVATGVDIHEAAFFGRVGPWINTTFALALMWLCMTGAMSWWRRKPEKSLGVPPAPNGTWPWWLRGVALTMFLVLPLLLLSAVAVWVVETLWQRRQWSGRAG